jgi:predicted kinase
MSEYQRKKTVQGHPHLYMMVGLPGAGKSTAIEKMIARNKKVFGEDYKYVVLSTDKYIEEVAKSNGKTYNEVFKECIGSAEIALNHSLKLAIDFDCDIYWDQTNLSKKARAKKLARIPEKYYRNAVLLDVDRTTIQEQLNKRVREGGKFISANVVNDMAKTYEVPTRDEGFDQIYRYSTGTIEHD